MNRKIVTILDYGLGNITSLVNSLKYLNGFSDIIHIAICISLDIFQFYILSNVFLISENGSVYIGIYTIIFFKLYVSIYYFLGKINLTNLYNINPITEIISLDFNIIYIIVIINIF